MVCRLGWSAKSCGSVVCEVVRRCNNHQPVRNVTALAAFGNTSGALFTKISDSNIKRKAEPHT
jgi:hypothetical protein